jgi:corrinoid protein of di/trimethylamine methyltransferase
MGGKMELAQIKAHVMAGDKKKTESLVRLALAENTASIEVLDVLMQGIYAIGEKWGRLEVFLPEVLMATNAMKTGMLILEPHLKDAGGWKHKGTVVVGTVKGDQHDIGKSIVATMLVSGGFNVHDIGIDQPAIRFIEKAQEVNADIIAASSLLSTTMQGQKDLVDLLENSGERNRFRVMVGGGPVTQQWADSIGADAYGETASDALRIANDLMRGRP